MRKSICLLLVLFSNYISGQNPVIDRHPLIGKLNGKIDSITIITNLTDSYSTPRADTLVYRLNITRDTAWFFKNSFKTGHIIHIYNQNSQLIKEVNYYPGNNNETSFSLRKHKKLEITTEKNNIGDYIRIDTTKSYYDKSNRLIKIVETNNRTKSRFTTVYKYDFQGNLTDERYYVYNGDINPSEELSKHMKITYKYDEYKNWVIKDVSFVSTLTGETYQRIYSKRTISYRQNFTQQAVLRQQGATNKSSS